MDGRIRGRKSVLNATEYMVIMNEAQINDGNAPRCLQIKVAKAGKVPIGKMKHLIIYDGLPASEIIK